MNADARSFTTLALNKSNWYSLCMFVLFSLKCPVASKVCKYFTFEGQFGQE